MPELPKPLNLLELSDGQSKSLTVLRHEIGETVIFPAHAPQGKTVKVLRLHVRPEDHPSFPHYFDVTSSRLYAQWLPQLSLTDRLTVRWKVTARGIPPTKYFTLERAPA